MFGVQNPAVGVMDCRVEADCHLPTTPEMAQLEILL